MPRSSAFAYTAGTAASSPRIDQIEHGHHVFRAYFKNAFLKQYEKFSTFLRIELCANNLADFGLKKGLDNLDAVRQTLQAVTDRFASFEAQSLNVHVDFPLLQRIALPITIGRSAIRASKSTIGASSAYVRLSCMPAVTSAAGRAKQIHQAVLTTFHLSEQTYGLNQLRYDLWTCPGFVER